MKILISLALIVLFCAGCASLQQEEELLEKIKRTSSIVQVQPADEVFYDGLFVEKDVGVLTRDPKEVKQVVDAISVDKIGPEAPWMGWLGKVVFLDIREKPLAMVQINVGGSGLIVWPCVRTRKGYGVPVTPTMSYRSVYCSEAWNFLYKHLPVIDPEALALKRDFYKSAGLDPDRIMFGSRPSEGQSGSTNAPPNR